jgi:DNA anti-recombination protein RmuC
LRIFDLIKDSFAVILSTPLTLMLALILFAHYINDLHISSHMSLIS